MKKLILSSILISSSMNCIDIENFYKNKEVLVTGGAGFIGSHITDKLVELGAKVTVLDNLSTGKLENLAQVIDKITFINGSVTDPQDCLRATENKEVVFHLAAKISVPESILHTDLFHKINVAGTANIFAAARTNKVKNVVFSSSSAVYGTKDVACSESMEPMPESPYGFNKLIGEIIGKQYSRLGINVVNLRYFNVFGERQDPKGEYAGVIAKFKDLMSKNLPITIFGDGQQSRDFIPVYDVVIANLTAGACAEELKYDIINVATGRSIPLLELVNILKKDFPTYNQEIIFAPARSGDILISAAKIDKLQKLLNF